MPLQMVDRDQRLARGHRQRLGRHQPDHHPADQPRPGGRGNGIDIIQRQPRISQRSGDQGRQPHRMGARGNLRHNPAIGRVLGVLRGDPLGKNPPPDTSVIGHQRRRRLVARGFDTQNQRQTDPQKA